MIWWLLAGCGGPCDAGGRPTLELGLGTDEVYQPIQDGAEAVLVYGRQGGQHIDLGIEATNLEQMFTSAAVIEGRIDGTVVAQNSPWFEFECKDDVLQVGGLRLLMLVEPEQVADQLLDVLITVTDSRGTEASAERSVRVIDVR